MTELAKIEGIGKVFAEKLARYGINSIEELLEKGATPAGRAHIAEGTGISSKQILEWINHADLFRIDGVGEEYADLLEEAGVDTIPELAQRNPANLHKQLDECNQAKDLVRRLPSVAQVEDWVNQAKKLPRVIQY